MGSQGCFIVNANVHNDIDVIFDLFSSVFLFIFATFLFPLFFNYIGLALLTAPRHL